MELQELHNFTDCDGNPLGRMLSVATGYTKLFCQYFCLPFVGCCEPFLPSDIYDCREHSFLETPVDLSFWFQCTLFWVTLATIFINRGRVETMWQFLVCLISMLYMRDLGLSPISRIPDNWLQFLFYVFCESGAYFVFLLGVSLPPKE